MKKVLVAVSLVVMTCSCSTFRSSTSTSLDVATSMSSVNSAELDVADTKISYTYYPKKRYRKAGLKHILSNATAAALRENGDADVLVGRQYEVLSKPRLLRKKIKSVTVTGYPATYRNFKSGKPCAAPCAPACDPRKQSK